MSSPSRLVLAIGVLASLLVASPARAATTADLSLTLQHAPASVAAGEDVVFSFAVTNAGPDRATAVQVSYGVTGGRWWSYSGDVGSGFADGGRFLIGAGNLEPGETRPFTVTVRADRGTAVAIDAVASAFESDPDSAGNSVQDSATVLPALRDRWRLEAAAAEPASMIGASTAYHPTMGADRTGRGFTFGGIWFDGVNVSLTRSYRSWAGSNWSSGEGYSTDPPARAWGAMAYNPIDKTIVLFGGLGEADLLADTWVLTEDQAWVRKTPAVSPPARYGAGLAFAGGGLVLFGGESDETSLSDTWRWNGTTWSKLTTATSPSPRSAMTFTADEANGNAVLFGGCCDDNISVLADTWTFDGSTWLKKMPALSPPARADGAAAYDRTAGAVTLFGGGTDEGILNDLWTWSGSTWSSITAAGDLPTVRDGSALFFSPATRSAPGRLVLYGGRDDLDPHMRDTYTIALSGPSAMVAPRTLSFGAVPVPGTAAPKTVTVTNMGTEPLAITGATLSGTHAADYGAGTSACAAPVAPGGSCVVTVTHTARGIGARTATLTIANDAAATLVVALSSTGVAATLTTPGLVSGKYVNASFPVAWSAPGSGLTFDVEWMERYRTSGGWYADGPWRRWKTGVGGGTTWFGSSGQPPSVPGHTYLFRVRARNGPATGSWTALKSAIVPVDDRSTWLGWSSGWSSPSAGGRYFATLRVGTSSSRWMTLVTDTNMFWLIGERCPSCGQVRIYVDGALVATVDTYGRTTTYRQTLWSRYLTGGIRRHTLKIVPVGTPGRSDVKIDAVGLAR